MRDDGFSVFFASRKAARVPEKRKLSVVFMSAVSVDVEGTLTMSVARLMWLGELPRTSVLLRGTSWMEGSGGGVRVGSDWSSMRTLEVESCAVLGMAGGFRGITAALATQERMRTKVENEGIWK